MNRQEGFQKRRLNWVVQSAIRTIVSTSCILASAFDASDFLTTIFSDTFKTFCSQSAWGKVEVTNEQQSPIDWSEKLKTMDRSDIAE